MPKFDIELSVIRKIICGKLIEANNEEEAKEKFLTLYANEELDEYIEDEYEQQITINEWKGK